jgi:hypothetical protein
VVEYVCPPKAVVNNMPNELILDQSLSGWMVTERFFEYVANDFNNWFNKKNIKRPQIAFVHGIEQILQ